MIIIIFIAIIIIIIIRVVIIINIINRVILLTIIISSSKIMMAPPSSHFCVLLLSSHHHILTVRILMIIMNTMIMMLALIIMNRCCLNNCWEVRGQVRVCWGLSWGRPGGNVKCVSWFCGLFVDHPKNVSASTIVGPGSFEKSYRGGVNGNHGAFQYPNPENPNTYRHHL